MLPNVFWRSSPSTARPASRQSEASAREARPSASGPYLRRHRREKPGGPGLCGRRDRGGVASALSPCLCWPSFIDGDISWRARVRRAYVRARAACPLPPPFPPYLRLDRYIADFKDFDVWLPAEEDIAACEGQDDFPDGQVRDRPGVKRIHGLRSRAKVAKFNQGMGLHADDNQRRCSCCRYPAHTAGRHLHPSEEDGLVGYTESKQTCVLGWNLPAGPACEDLRQPGVEPPAD